MTATLLLAVCLAGGLGAVLRLVVDGVIRQRVRAAFPVATLIINVTGSLLLGLLVGLTLGQVLPKPYEIVAGTGFLGGYTTFSTASFETVRLLEERRYAAALVNGLGMLGLSVAAAAAGLAVGLWL